MSSDPSAKPTDARLIGMAARAVRRARGMTAQQVADAMNLPLRTYEYFEAGAGRTNLDYVQRFAQAANCDPWSLLLSPGLGSVDFARRTADSKLMLVFLIALGEFEIRMGDAMISLDPRALIEGFSETFRKLEHEHRAKGAATESWLNAGRDRLGAKPNDDGSDPLG